jgi:membrane protein implicated in regulation of membrane protease activity
VVVAAAFGFAAVVLGRAVAFGLAAVVLGLAAVAFGFAAFGFAVAVLLAALVARADRPSRLGRVDGSEPRTEDSGFAARLADFFAGFLDLADLSLIGVVWDARSDDLDAACW